MKSNTSDSFEGSITSFIKSYIVGIAWRDNKVSALHARRIMPLLSESEFQDIAMAGEEEERMRTKRFLSAQKSLLESGFRRSLLDDFIEGAFGDATNGEKSFIRSKVQEIYSRTDPHELEYELESFLLQGLQGIRKQYFKEKGVWAKTKKYIGYLWDVCVGLFEALVLVVVIGAMETNSTAIIMAALAMVYIQIRALALGASFMYPRILEAFNKEFIQIRTMLLDGAASFDFGKAQHAAKLRRDLEVRIYIRIGFLALMSVYVTLILVVTALR